MDFREFANGLWVCLLQNKLYRIIYNFDRRKIYQIEYILKLVRLGFEVLYKSSKKMNENPFIVKMNYK